MDGLKKVKYYKEDKIQATKYIYWPQTYEDFLKDIIKIFKINTEKENIIIQLITNDEEKIIINNQEDFDEYQEDDNIKEIKFYLEGKDDASSKHYKNKKNQNKLNEDNKKVGMPICDLMDDIFNYAKQKVKANMQNYADYFKTNLEQSIRKVMDEKLFAIKNSIYGLNTDIGAIKNQLNISNPKNGFIQTNFDDSLEKVDDENDGEKKEEKNSINEEKKTNQSIRNDDENDEMTEGREIQKDMDNYEYKERTREKVNKQKERNKKLVVKYKRECAPNIDKDRELICKKQTVISLLSIKDEKSKIIGKIETLSNIISDKNNNTLSNKSDNFNSNKK